MTRSTLGALAAGVAALLLPGCSKAPPPIVPVEGVVLVNNEPLANVQVQFTPMAANLGYESIATGTTDDQGRFQLTCKGQPGACAVRSRVTITEAPMPENVRGNQAEEGKFHKGLKNRPIPEKYANVAQTPLTIAVTAGQTEYKLELTR